MARRDRGVSVQAAAVVFSVFVAVMVGFAVLALFDEAPAAAALFVGTAALPLTLLAVRAWTRVVGWVATIADAGMAWSIPSLGSTVVLGILASQTALAAWLTTVLVSSVTTGGGLLAEEWLHATQRKPESSA